VWAAVFGTDATTPVSQLWLFWVAPIVGASIGGVVHRVALDTDDLPSAA
jgi:glycerol uptake facilitator-like aquaporin